MNSRVIWGVSPQSPNRVGIVEYDIGIPPSKGDLMFVEDEVYWFVTEVRLI